MKKQVSGVLAVFVLFLSVFHTARAEGDTVTYSGIGIGAGAISGPGMRHGTSWPFGVVAGVRHEDLAFESSILLYGLLGSYKTENGARATGLLFTGSVVAFTPVGAHDAMYAKLGYTYPRTGLNSGPGVNVAGSNRPGTSYGLGIELETRRPGEPMRIGVDRLPVGVFGNTTRLTYLHLDLLYDSK